jgi:hypothetical protein
MRLASIEIPNSWYLISSKKKNNSFIIIIKSAETLEVLDIKTITIPDGNYDNITLEGYLNTQCFYQASPLDVYLKYLKCTIDPYSFKFTIESINNNTLTDPVNHILYSFIFYNPTALIVAQNNKDCKQHKQSHSSSQYTALMAALNSKCVAPKNGIDYDATNTLGWIFGFRKYKYEDLLVNSIPSTILISESLFDVGGDRYVYFCVDDYQNSQHVLNVACFNNFVIEKNIIAKIPMVNGKLSIIINDNDAPLTKIRKYNGPVNISTLNMKIIDKFGEVIDLNSLDYSFTLELEILYEGFNFKIS